MWALGLGARAWGPPRGGNGRPAPPHRCLLCRGGWWSCSVQAARADPALSTLQVTLPCRATPCEWRPPTTTSSPWCSSRRSPKTRSTSRSPSTVGLQPALGDPAPVPVEGGKGHPRPSPRPPPVLSLPQVPGGQGKRAFHSPPAPTPRGRGLRFVHPFNNIHGASPGRSPQEGPRNCPLS